MLDDKKDEKNAYDDTTSFMGWVSGGDKLDKTDPFRTYTLNTSARLPVGEGELTMLDKSKKAVKYEWYLIIVNDSDKEGEIGIIYAGATQLISTAFAIMALTFAF